MPRVFICIILFFTLTSATSTNKSEINLCVTLPDAPANANVYWNRNKTLPVLVCDNGYKVIGPNSATCDSLKWTPLGSCKPHPSDIGIWVTIFILVMLLITAAVCIYCCQSYKSSIKDESNEFVNKTFREIS